MKKTTTKLPEKSKTTTVTSVQSENSKTTIKKIVNKRPHLSNVQSFTNKYAGPALEMEKQYGIPAIAVLAQVALETGWGQKVLKVHVKGEKDLIDSKNLFNIKSSKSWDGEVGAVSVWEDYNKDGERTPDEYEDAFFKVYVSYADAFKDYAKLITETKRYAPAVAVAKDPNKYVQALQDCGFATDGHYAEKMQKIMATNWDVIES